MWLVLHDCILTWDNLLKRGWQGPSICSFCKLNVESTLHIFFHCSFANVTWHHICSSLGLTGFNYCVSMEAYYRHWFSTMVNHRALFLFVRWHIWLCRNALIFNGTQSNAYLVSWRSIHHFSEFTKNQVVKDRLVASPLIFLDYSVGFFDGVAQGRSRGCGFVLCLSESHKIQGWLHLVDC